LPWASALAAELPPEPERAERLAVVLHVLYLMFNESYAATSGPVEGGAGVLDPLFGRRQAADGAQRERHLRRPR